jgi:heme exporter protein C
MEALKRSWWKWLAAVLVIYAVAGGMLMKVPALPILHETIRNLYFHVTMWFGMMILMTVSLVYSIRHLRHQRENDDRIAREFALTGTVMGILGILTGSLWARYTWGDWWVNDPKLNGAAITLLIYFAYFVLRNSVDEVQKRGRLAAVYSIFAFVMLLVFLLILPRTTVSLHPGNGGNPGFSAYEDDLDGTMRTVFYPAIIGWTLIGVWVSSLRIRISKIQDSLEG